MNQGEIVVYKPDHSEVQFEVFVDNDTVWLNRHQISLLFERDIKTIGKHITNALHEELQGLQVVAKFATTATDGKTYQVEHYNLDLIISVGYRVKSERGILFRIWANNILKDYLLKGYAVHQRFENIEKDIYSLKKKTEEFDLHIKTSLPPHEGIFFDGQIFDAYAFVCDIVKQATQSIVLIDNYIDESTLLLLAKRHKNVAATIYTNTITKQLQIDIEKHKAQYQAIEIKTFAKSHDRFLIIDNQTVYHIGASLKDLGKKWFAFSKMEWQASDLLAKLEITY